MMGEMKDPTLKGIIPRIVEAIFQGILDADSTIEFTVKVSYVEIYNEKVRDLLNSSKDNLKVSEHEFEMADSFICLALCQFRRAAAAAAPPTSDSPRLHLPPSLPSGPTERNAASLAFSFSLSLSHCSHPARALSLDPRERAGRVDRGRDRGLRGKRRDGL